MNTSDSREKQQREKSTQYETHLYNGEQVSSSVANEPTTVKGSTATQSQNSNNTISENRIIMSNGDKFKEGTKKNAPFERTQVAEKKRTRGTYIASKMPVNSITLQFVQSICMCVWVISFVVPLLSSTLLRFLYAISLFLVHFCFWDFILRFFYSVRSLFIKFPVLLVATVISCVLANASVLIWNCFYLIVFVSLFCVFTTLVSLFNGLYNVHSHSDFAWYLLLAIYEKMCECVRATFLGFMCMCVCHFGFRLRLLVWIVEMA